MNVRVTFDSRSARLEFISAWKKRTGGEPIDRVVNGVCYSDSNADRALDIANEVEGVSVQEVL